MIQTGNNLNFTSGDQIITMSTIKDDTNITSPKRLTMNIKLKISPVYSDKLKQILQVLKNDDALGDYFIRFLLNHTLNELSNGEDYLKN